MKRVVICSALLVLAILVSVYSHIKITNVDREMNTRIDAMLKILPSKDREALVEQSNHLSEYWREQEDVLVHLTRHSHLDQIATGVTRLPLLAEYGEFAEFGAELSSMRRQMEHIRDSEMLALKNIL